MNNMITLSYGKGQDYEYIKYKSGSVSITRNKKLVVVIDSKDVEAVSSFIETGLARNTKRRKSVE